MKMLLNKKNLMLLLIMQMCVIELNPGAPSLPPLPQMPAESPLSGPVVPESSVAPALSGPAPAASTMNAEPHKLKDSDDASLQPESARKSVVDEIASLLQQARDALKTVKSLEQQADQIMESTNQKLDQFYSESAAAFGLFDQAREDISTYLAEKKGESAAKVKPGSAQTSDAVITQKIDEMQHGIDGMREPLDALKKSQTDTDTSEVALRQNVGQLRSKRATLVNNYEQMEMLKNDVMRGVGDAQEILGKVKKLWAEAQAVVATIQSQHMLDINSLSSKIDQSVASGKGIAQTLDGVLTKLAVGIDYIQKEEEKTVFEDEKKLLEKINRSEVKVKKKQTPSAEIELAQGGMFAVVFKVITVIVVSIYEAIQDILARLQQLLGGTPAATKSADFDKALPAALPASADTAKVLPSAPGNIATNAPALPPLPGSNALPAAPSSVLPPLPGALPALPALATAPSAVATSAAPAAKDAQPDAATQPADSGENTDKQIAEKWQTLKAAMATLVGSISGVLAHIADYVGATYNKLAQAKK